ncbi:MAG: thiol-disulfide oxidoreductase DCC family protein, partial [Bacteroidetes bacterium]|nr:thiol-disulfide oxidoreductase DCC family protein [Bacteroidota bacterium]
MTTWNRIILFDGVCNLCNASIQFIIKRDKKNLFKFASLQSDVGKSLLAQHHIDGTKMDSVVYIENGKAFTESTAAIRVAGYLGFPWNLLQVFLIVPSMIRNVVYQWIARNRYKWFGKQDSCMLPDASLEA